ncbi:MAG: glycerophosphodiester phosphodiesterase family protein [Pseudomonadota bacterium]
MSRLLFVLFTLALGTVTPTVASGPPTYDPAADLIAELHDPNGRVMVTAHRACWAEGPENSVAAIEACTAVKPDIIEIDLRLTTDGKLVVIHDPTLSRMAGVDRPIAEMTLAEIRSHPLRERDGRGDAMLTDERTPTFTEILRANARRHLLILDLKSEAQATAAAAAKVLRQENACDIAMVAFVAPPDEARKVLGPLLDCATYIPNLRAHMGSMGAVSQSYAELDPIAVAVRFDDWDYLYEGTADVRAMGVRLWVNTLDDHHAAGLVDADALVDPEALWGALLMLGSI